MSWASVITLRTMAPDGASHPRKGSSLRPEYKQTLSAELTNMATALGSDAECHDLHGAPATSGRAFSSGRMTRLNSQDLRHTPTEARAV